MIRDAPHPNSNDDLKAGNTHTIQAIPRRKKLRENAQQLQERHWNIQKASAKGDQNQPEEPAPMAPNADNQHTDKRQYPHEKQRYQQWMRSIPRLQREYLHINSRINSVH